MILSNKKENSLSNEFEVPFYRRPLFASIAIGIISIIVIIFTQRYVTLYMETELALVTEISVATLCMFFLFIVVNQLQSSVTKKEAAEKHNREIEMIRSEFTSIASRDIAEASTAIKWGIRTLEPTFNTIKESDKETLLHIRDKNDHILEIVRSLLVLSKIERKEIVISPSSTNVSGVIENLLSTMEPRIKAKGTKTAFVPPPEAVIIETDHIVLSELLQSVFTYCLERTRGPQDTVSIRAFTVNLEGQTTTRILITDDAPGVAEYIRKDIFARAIRNPHTGELENTQLGPHVAKLLSELLGVTIEATINDTQTSFSISFPPLQDKK